MLKYYVVKEAIEEIAPIELQENWDNSGTQIFTGKEDVNSILVALEITEAVVSEAKKLNVDLILTHHPLIFRPVASIDCDTSNGKLIAELLMAGISVYSAHTSFDKVEGGNNTDLAERLKLKNVEPLVDSLGNELIGGMGELPEEMDVKALKMHVAKALDINEAQVRLSGPRDISISKVGFCTGAGAEFAFDAAKLGCDAFITGDVKYHDAQNALAEGIVLVDAGHYGTEYIFAANMAEKLSDAIGAECEIHISKENINPFLDL